MGMSGYVTSDNLDNNNFFIREVWMIILHIFIYSSYGIFPERVIFPLYV